MDSYKDAIKHIISYTENKQIKVDGLRNYLIRNVNDFYPNVSSNEFSDIFDVNLNLII